MGTGRGSPNHLACALSLTPYLASPNGKLESQYFLPKTIPHAVGLLAIVCCTATLSRAQHLQGQSQTPHPVPAAQQHRDQPGCTGAGAAEHPSPKATYPPVCPISPVTLLEKPSTSAKQRAFPTTLRSSTRHRPICFWDLAIPNL